MLKKSEHPPPHVGVWENQCKVSSWRGRIGGGEDEVVDKRQAQNIYGGGKRDVLVFKEIKAPPPSRLAKSVYPAIWKAGREGGRGIRDSHKMYGGG